MTTTHNTQSSLPFGMSHVTRPDFIRAGHFLYSQYPGIHKMKISRWKHFRKDGAFIKLTSSGPVRRRVSAGGYSLANAVGNLIAKIKQDEDLTGRLRHPERYQMIS